MIRRSTLRARVARLQPARPRHVTAPRMCFGIWGGADEQISGIGVLGGDAAIARNPGESVSDLQDRGELELKSKFLYLVDNCDVGLVDEAPRPKPTPAPEIEPPTPAEYPWNLAGIGRTDEKYIGYWQPES